MVCSGELRINDDWAEWDLACDVPVNGRYIIDRHQTRYCDENYLNSKRPHRRRISFR